MNAEEASTLFQDVAGIAAGSIIGYQFAHRGRFSDFGDDSMRLTITDLGTDNIPGGNPDTILFTGDFSTSNQAWRYYFGRLDNNPTLGNTIRFAYESLNGLDPQNGNYIDAANFGLNAGFAPVPGPLPIVGTATAFAFSRRLRKRIHRSASTHLG